MAATVARVLTAHSRGAVPEVLDRLAEEHGCPDWPTLFGTLPKFPPVINWGSPNQRALNSGLGLLHPVTRTAALASWKNARALEVTQGWELEEPGSRIYRPWSLLGRLLGWWEPDREFAQYLRDWLQLYWVRYAISSFPTPWGQQSLATGARSQGKFGRLHDDYAASLAFGTPFLFRQGVDKSWQKSSYEVAAYQALRPVLEESGAEVRETIAQTLHGWPDDLARELVALAPAWPTLAVTWYLRTTRGLAVWVDNLDRGPEADDIPNSNTPGIAAMGWDEGNPEPWSLPPPSRDHVRQKTVIEAITALGSDGQPWRPGDEEEAPTSLHYNQGGAGRSLQAEHALPGGDLLYLIRHDSRGMRVLA